MILAVSGENSAHCDLFGPKHENNLLSRLSRQLCDRNLKPGKYVPVRLMYGPQNFCSSATQGDPLNFPISPPPPLLFTGTLFAALKETQKQQVLF